MKRGEREDRREAAELNALTEGIIGAAIKVHRELGPGLLESAYEACLHFELGRQGYSVVGLKPQPVGYDGLLLDCGYRLDLLVEEEVVVELKAAAQVTKLDERQLLTYLRLADCRTSLRRTQAATLRVRLFKRAARVKESLRRFVLRCPV